MGGEDAERDKRRTAIYLTVRSREKTTHEKRPIDEKIPTKQESDGEMST